MSGHGPSLGAFGLGTWLVCQRVMMPKGQEDFIVLDGQRREVDFWLDGGIVLFLLCSARRPGWFLDFIENSLRS